ncbi:hypothetical protein BH23ACI1_BH23ACI1_12750 [soil metagenome]
MTASPRSAGQRGAALVITLMVTAIVTALGGALLLVTMVESAVEANHQQTHAVRQAAEAGLACGIAGLAVTEDWSNALQGLPVPGPPCLEPAAFPPSFPGGGDIEPAALTAALQAMTSARYGTVPDTPRWELWIAGAAPGAAASGPVVLVWIADDEGEDDGDPAVDANGVLWVRAEAFGRGSARTAVEALVRRNPPEEGATAVIGWRLTR